MLKENLIKVKEKWRQECVKVAEPLSKYEITKKFSDYGFIISQDVVEVFSTIGGFSEEGMDSECLSFWTVEKILNENEQNSERVYFADFLIDSHHYYFKYGNAEVSEIFVSHSETDISKIADSFNDFFELYLNDINSLFV